MEGFLQGADQGFGEDAEKDENPEVVEARRQDARQMFQEAEAARATATQEQIEGQGISPNEKELSPDPAQEGQASKRIKIDKRNVRKVYNNQKPAAGGTTDASRSAAAGPSASKPTQDPKSRAKKRPKSKVHPDLRKVHREYIRRRQELMDELISSSVLIELPGEASDQRSSFDLIGSICTSADLAVEMCKHLRPREIVMLYSISKDFHDVMNTFMQSCMLVIARHQMPAATRIFHPRLYRHICIRDPEGRPRDPAYHDLAHLSHGLERPPIRNTETRLVPGLKWLQMVYHRGKRVRDIIASMARRGHRLAKNSNGTLCKIWLMMDVATNSKRRSVITNRHFTTEQDLYNAQLFFVKLLLLFNDPVYGPGSGKMLYVFMGQKGLTPLWQLLRRKGFTRPHELMQAAVRYDIPPTEDQIETAMPIIGVPIHEAGIGHKEGWGRGLRHLMRPDQLVPLEAVRRSLDLDLHLEFMTHFGHVDLMTGRNLAPSLGEMYMSDDDLPWPDEDFEQSVDGGCGNVPFEPGMWLPRQARKSRWGTLTEAQRKEILRLDGAEVEDHLDYKELEDEESEEEIDIAQRTFQLRAVRMLKRKAEAEAKAAKRRGKGKEKGKNKWDCDSSNDGDLDDETNSDDSDAMEVDGDDGPAFNLQAPSPEPAESLQPALRDANTAGCGLVVPSAGSRVVSGGSSIGLPSMPEPEYLAGRSPSGSTLALDAAQEAAGTTSDGGNAMEIDVEDATSGVPGRHVEFDEEDGEMAVQPVETPNSAPSLTQEQIQALDDEADMDYDSEELSYPWEEIVQASAGVEESEPLSVAEIEELGQATQATQATQNDDGSQSDPMDGIVLVESEEEFLNPTQVVLYKKDEDPDSPDISDVELDDDGDVQHVDFDENDGDSGPEYEPDEFTWDQGIKGKNWRVRSYYRRY